MEPSPVIKAHDHALAASKATKSADTTVAISEHTFAAGEFANAAQSTTSIEALRTLKLLEQHHRRLSELLQLPSRHPAQAADTDADNNVDGDEKQLTSAKDASTTSEVSTKSGKAAAKTPQVPSLLGQQRHSSRDVSSSIVSNLASARGIRLKYGGQPVAPSVSGNAASGDLDPLPRRRDGSKTKMQTMLEHPPKPVRAPQDPSQKKQEAHPIEAGEDGQDQPESAEDGYSRFYSSFGSLFNKLSAPLAFAGLPLIAEEPSATQEPQAPEPTSPKKSRQHRRQAQAPGGDPDLSKIYSKAALRLVSRDGHAASDSFYVVPTSGHTMSYANILTFAEKEKRRMEASLHTSSSAGDAIGDDEDDFVDARETPQALSPTARRRIGKARTERDLNNTIEELCLENKSLKDMLDKLSRRLHAFEASAQNSSLALAESMRLMRPGSPHASTSATAGGADERSRRERAEMEERLASAVRHIEVLEKDNLKMQKTLGKYRDKWDQLKESAKARRGGGQATGGESPALGGAG
ncbi:uncharacterized protein DNG_08539 [Cephalotrichum gorgonifer]|uniref:Uncharacterized protein n=1 Tax=Cephalotrichum gorgonifer TaxID=2041049 RepID=A0AAE8SZ98_9PEZI|nr:uncharacterized protein DNG_08539 [Cephalotrichum gorgonifer]